jgi:cytochrome P450
LLNVFSEDRTFVFHRMNLMHCATFGCLADTLRVACRLLPAVAGMNRLTQVPMVLAGHQIPAGTRVGVPGIVNQRSERHYPAPMELRPERWLRGCPAHHTAHPFAHLPFSHGPRMCIGRRFAELEVQVLTVRVLQRFRLEDPTDRPLDMVTPFTSRPDGPVRIRFLPRRSAQ